MLKIITAYILIAVFIYTKNKINYLRCNYVINNLIANAKNKKYNNNFNYINSVESLLSGASIYSPVFLDYSKLANGYYLNSIIEHLEQARGIYRHRYIHSLFWGYPFLKKIKIFKPIFNKSTNIIVSIVICLVEGFLVYLLGLYLDTTGIGNKILICLTDFASSLIEHIR